MADLSRFDASIFHDFRLARPTDHREVSRFAAVVNWLRHRWPLLTLIVTMAVVCWPALIFIPLLRAPFELLLSRRPTRAFGWRTWWRWRRTVRGYRSLAYRRFIVRYDGACVDNLGASQISKTIDRELAELQEWHGVRPVGRVCVFILPTVKHIQDIFGNRYGGLACAVDNTIVVPAAEWIDGTLRHELAHLFTAKWNRRGLPLLNEGFAVWWQHRDESTMDALAHYFLQHTRHKIRNLIDPKSFYERKCLEPAYYLAGSFVSFLVRRNGKECFRDFYRRATHQNFERCFREYFGLSLAVAEVSWRMEVSTTQLLRQRLERFLRC